MFYSKTTGGFYTPDIHGENIPSDAVEITDEQYVALFDGQAGGKQIVGDEDGRPILVEPPEPEPVVPPTKEELMAKLLEIQAQLENI
jgi:hypothetical protein